MSKSQNQAASSNATNNQANTAAATSAFQNSLATPLANATANQSATGAAAFSGFGGAGSDASQMAMTGGFTPAQETAYMDQATSGAQATYGTLMQQEQQDRAKTGGLGLGNEYSQLARQETQAQTGAEQTAAVNLNTQENSNKISGIQQMIAASGGMAALFDEDTGQVTALGNQVLQSMGIDVTSEGQATQALTALATSSQSGKGPLATTLGAIGSVGGIISGINP